MRSAGVEEEHGQVAVAWVPAEAPSAGEPEVGKCRNARALPTPGKSW